MSDEEINEYQKVKSFDDLIDSNVKFLKNEVHRRETLIDLNTKYRVYITNYQISMYSDYKIQQSYLDFIVDEKLGKKLEPLLFDCPLIYTCVSYYRYQDDNFPTRKYNLIRDRKCISDQWRESTNWRRNIRYSDDLNTLYHNVNDILSDCRVFCIVVKDPLCGQEADDILLSILARH